MRTTVTLDQDVQEIATLYSKARAVTLGAAIGELVRKGLEARNAEPSPSPRLKRLANGMLVFAGTGKAITSEMVKEAPEEGD
jgi:hypothetical protein